MEYATNLFLIFFGYSRDTRVPATMSMRIDISAVIQFVTGLNKAIAQARDSVTAVQASMMLQTPIGRILNSQWVCSEMYNLCATPRA